MSNNEEIITTLIKLGLTRTQARTYLATLKTKKSATLSSIAQISDIARPDVYRAVEKLIQLGLIEKLVTNPAAYRALPVAHAAEVLIQRRSKETLDINNVLNVLIKDQNCGADNFEKNDKSQFVLFSSKALLEKKITDLLKNSKGYVCFMFPRDNLLRLSNIFLDNKDFQAKEWHIRIITQTLPEKVPIYINQILSDPHVEIRLLQQSPTVCYRIFDDSELLLTTLPHKQSDMCESCGKETRAIWSDNPAIIELAKTHFEVNWQIAKLASIK
jgi:sugar-specific transcriptional regulator TrmB